MADVKLDPMFRVNLTYSEMKLITFALSDSKMGKEDKLAALELAKKLLTRQADELRHYTSLLDGAVAAIEKKTE